MTITVCIGSGCHVKGSRRIIEILQELIAGHPQLEIQLSACFCRGQCTEGVVVQFDDHVITGVSAENIHGIFRQQLEAAQHEHHYNE